MKKYVVYITLYSGTKLPKWYIGSSYGEKINNGYNGSVKSKKYSTIYKNEQTNHKYLFRTKILSHHTTREEALSEELRLQKKHNVVTNDKYINMSYAQKNGSHGRDVSGVNNPFYGKTHSEKSKEKISYGLNNIDKELLHKKRIATINKPFIDENGNETTKAKEMETNRQSTLNKPFIDENGNETTKAKEAIKKMKSTINKPFIDENGNETTKAKEKLKKVNELMDKEISINGEKTSMRNLAIAKGQKTRNEGKQRYNIYCIYGGLVEENLLKCQMLKYSSTLIRTTKEEFLGKNKLQRDRLIKKGKGDYIGYYIEKC